LPTAFPSAIQRGALRLDRQVGRTALKDVEKPEGIEKIEGVVKHLHYARRSEVNGAVLANGDFVHLGLHGAELVKLVLSQKLSIEGA
jgi:hypothetical protein